MDYVYSLLPVTNILDVALVICGRHIYLERSAPPKKAGGDHAIGRSKGGLSTKIHALVDALGHPQQLLLTDGQDHDQACQAFCVRGWCHLIALSKGEAVTQRDHELRSGKGVSGDCTLNASEPLNCSVTFGHPNHVPIT
jgi:hypothetical protein